MPPGSLFYGGGGGGSLFYGAGQGSSPGVASGGVNLEAVERTGRRMSLLETYANDLVLSSPAGALAMVESPTPDDTLLRSATEATNYANIQRLSQDITQESVEVQDAMFKSLPTPIAEALTQMGYRPPNLSTTKDGGGRFGINLPDFVPGLPDELTLSDDTPILGPTLGRAQHGVGEVLEGARDVGFKALEPFAWLGEQPAHLYRAWKFQEEEMGAGMNLFAYFTPSQLSQAWEATEKHDGYVRPAQRNRAQRLLGNDKSLYGIAHGLAMGKTADQIIEDAGFSLDSPEAMEMSLQILTAQGMEEVQEAIHQLQVGQVSFGRTIAQDSLGLDDTDAGLGRLVSGTLDAGFAIASDPTLAVGRLTRAARFGRHAFRLETGGDVERMTRVTRIASNLHNERLGLATTHLVGDITPSDMRRARGVLNWSDHVANRFQGHEFAQLGRELPNTMTALGTMVDAHVKRAANGLTGLDDTQGVLEWLQARDGLLAVAGSRIGGASPMVRGLRMPSLTTAQRATMQTKGVWTKGIDWSRTQYAPKLGELVSSVGDPAALARQTGRWLVAHTAGDAGRVVAGLSAHTPYQSYMRLYGDEAVTEFSRLVNTGIFAGLDRTVLDDYVNAFAGGDFITRANIQEQFLEQLFRVTGVADTSFARRFVGRHRQAYSTSDTGDLVDIGGGLVSKGATLVDGHHADALAIPNVREFLRETKRINTTRYIFNNTPASYVDAALGRYWKPSVLMRIGFIPRAAGEELLHYALKHGPRTWLGAKGAEWVVEDELTSDLWTRLSEAEALGHVDEVNRLRSSLAEHEAFFGAPLRSLAGASDRMMTRLFSTDAVELSPWRRRIVEKGHAIDERGVVSGLERMANEVALWSSGAVERLAKTAHIPNRAEIGRVMAERWNPNALVGARVLLSDPRAARAYAERISGSTHTPIDFVGIIDENGAPVPKVMVDDVSGGMSVVREVQMRPLSGEYEVQRLNGVGGDVTAYFHSLYNRMMRVRKDRVGHAVLGNVLPRYVGDWGGDLAGLMGYGDDIGTFRDDLNKLWSFVSDSDDVADGRRMLSAARELVDNPEDKEALRTWLGKNIDSAAGQLGLNLDGRTLSTALLDRKLGKSPKHFVTYENVDAARLIDDWNTLERQMSHRARGRMSRPDMYRKLRETRLYASDERLAKPTVHGLTKVYVPFVGELPERLTDEFVDAATRQIRYIGGYSQEQAAGVARRVADQLTDPQTAGNFSGAIPLSAWGSADPRVADAVMSAADEVLGTRSTHGILEVPDEAVAAANRQNHLGLRAMTDWHSTDDFLVEPWRLVHARPTPQHRRFVRLEVGGEWFDEAELRNATTAYGAASSPGMARRYSTDMTAWADTPPPDQNFFFVDIPDADAARYGASLPDDLVNQYGPKRLPGEPPEDGRWLISDREMDEGLGEIEALERVADASIEEVKDTLTTLNRRDLDNDVLHEVTEPLLRGDRVYLDPEGNKVIEYGFGFDHLVTGTSWDRLPQETYGPRMAAARDFRWARFVSEWFEGPVDSAISSIIRKPMFVTNFGEQIANQRGLVDMFVDPALADDVGRLALDPDQLDTLALALDTGDGLDDVALRGLLDDLTGETLDLTDGQVATLRSYSGQRASGLSTVRQNALNRAMQLTIPYIDDHRIRSAFQNYVGNFMPFQFAEEQFLKRWVRSAIESPEIIAKGHLGMNGLRSMGVIRQDERGEDIFVYPLAGEAVAAMSGVAASLFGENLRVPFVGAMTGQVGYTLPGLGQRFGVPSVGPLVAMPLELLSRHYPELADIEQTVSGPGADRPVWSYFVPSWAGRVYSSFFADIDKVQLASATMQAQQMLALNGDMPPENATPEEQQEFIERATGIARTIILARGLLGMTTPAAPAFRTKADDLNAEYVEFLRTSHSAEEATAAFIAAHPDIEPANLLATTIFTSESEFPGLPTPTEETFNWIKENQDIVEGFPAAAPWLLPRGKADDPFSYRAWAQQIAIGLRKRKDPEEFVNDMRFAAAARDYFEAKTAHDADMLTAVGPERSNRQREWNAWKASYFRQHPVFARMLEDPTRQQRRGMAFEQLSILSADPDGPVAPELREFVAEYRDYKYAISALRGARTTATSRLRASITEEFANWAEWQTTQHPWLAGFYLRVVKPELRGLDEDAVVSSIT
jgi:hypothetical protein